METGGGLSLLQGEPIESLIFILMFHLELRFTKVCPTKIVWRPEQVSNKKLHIF
jgi:hypothetical protein